MDQVEQKLKRVCSAFRIEGALTSYEEFKQGNVNRTFRVDFQREDGTSKSYIVQKVNTYVFENPVAVMENIDQVTEYLRHRLPDRTTLHFHHTKERKTYVFDEDGFWRLFNFIPSRTFDHCEDLEVIRSAGQAFGEFQTALGEFDASCLHETIPFFHDTRKRYEKLIFDASVDPMGKKAEVQDELDWLLEVQDQACTLTDLYHQNLLPLRVTHNDTKINNVLFEKDSSSAIVVIDLDTVMPGLVGHDFGDAIRFAANRVQEDSKDWTNAGIDMKVFDHFAEGFLEQTAGTLTQLELDTLAVSCFAMTCELAVRFLDDYLLGSPYFKINYPEHNLVRARCQISLAKDLERHLEEMQKSVWQFAKQYR